MDKNIYNKINEVELPKFTQFLKNDLINSINTTEASKVEDYICTFLNYFKNYDSFTFFGVDLVEQDYLSVGLYPHRVYLERRLNFNSDFAEEFEYESYKIQFKIDLVNPETVIHSNKEREAFSIYKKVDGDYMNYRGFIEDKEAFETKIFSSSIYSKVAKKEPLLISLYLNCDI